MVVWVDHEHGRFPLHARLAGSDEVPPDLLGRVKRQAARAGIPYQTFMKSILEAVVSRPERRREWRRPVGRAVEVESEDDAIALTKRWPAGGIVEVRPVAE